MSAIDICKQNAAAATAARAERRKQFPFAAVIVDELVAEGLEPRVMRMREGELTWERTKPAERAA